MKRLRADHEQLVAERIAEEWVDFVVSLADEGRGKPAKLEDILDWDFIRARIPTSLREKYDGGKADLTTAAAKRIADMAIWHSYQLLTDAVSKGRISNPKLTELLR